jgi:PTS system nitrogen regulatory IIA component
MTIANLLAPENVLLDLRAGDKRQLLCRLARHLASALEIDAETAAAALLRREELGSTGMGDGIALPHARLPGLARARGLFARLRPAMDFQAMDGRPVDLVFLLLLPDGERGPGLNALAHAARRLRDPEVVQALRRASSPVDACWHLTADNARPGTG